MSLVLDTLGLPVISTLDDVGPDGCVQIVYEDALFVGAHLSVAEMLP